MKRLTFWARLLFGTSLIALLLYTTDVEKLQITITSRSLWLLGIAYLVGFVDRIFMAYKWNLLLRARQITISLVDATITYLMSTFLGLFLPSTVGGDAIRAFFISRAGHPAADVTSSIVLERALGLLALMFTVVGSILVGGLIVSSDFLANFSKILWIVSSGAMVTLLLIAISFSAWFRQRVWVRVQHSFQWASRFKVHRFLNQLAESYMAYRSGKKLLAFFVLLSVLENLFPVTWSYILALALGLQVSLIDCFVVVPSVLILRRLPLSIDGIGIHESAFVYLLTLVGVPGHQGLLLGMATHVFAVTLVLPGGLFAILRGVDSRQVQRPELA